MEIKGTAVKSTQEFVKSNFPEKYDKWIESLPENSQNIYKDVILSGKWYNLIDSIIIPTQKIGELFFDGEINKLAYRVGKESAIQALSGIYKIFVRIASVDFVLKRVKSIFSTYYSSGKIELESRSEKRDVFIVTGFKDEEKLIMERISGWIEGIFEVIFKTPKSVTHTIKNTEGDHIIVEIVASWE